MPPSIQYETLTALDYIEIILDKTKQNRALALTVSKKLFEELPQQISGIEEAFKSGQYENAKEITHKLHGSASFCGLVGIQEVAKKLEQCLLNNDHHEGVQLLQLLRDRVRKFTRYRESILAEFNRN